MKYDLPPKHSLLVCLLAMMVLAGTGTALAQTRDVSGTVKDEANAPLPGVSIVEKGTSNGTVTDSEGRFTIAVRDGAVLVVSFIGMKPQEVPVGNQSQLTISMESDVTELGEVVVVGYGEVDRKELTSSVSSLQARELKDLPINSAAQALAGRLAGVQVITSEGSPDADVQIRVRGGMSITGDNSPLYVVDGIQVENALSVLSPQDIESINVLKDASATAIYGSRGANGVVIITTKGGQRGRTSVSYSALYGIKQLGKKLDVWKPYDFVMYQYERSRGSATNETNFLETYGAFEDIELYRGVPFVDWQEEVFGRDAVMQTHNVSVNGGTEQTSFNLSLTSNQEEGVMRNSEFDRKLINFKLNHKVSPRTDVGFNVRYNNTVINGAGTSQEGSSSLNRLRHSVKYRPYISPGQSIDTYDPDYALETNANSLALINPILLTDAEYKRSQRNTANFSGNASYKITDFLSITSTLGVDLNTQQDKVFNDTITSTSKSNGQGLPMASIETTSRSIINNSNVIGFSSEGLPSFPTNHKLNVILGHEVYESETKINFQDYRLFPVGITPKLAFGTMQLGTAQPTSFTRESENRLLSFFSRVSYSYADRYFATFSYRADGSSKFAPEHRWGYFPAASVMWRVSSEPFWDGSVVSDLKIRASYGTAGNNRIGDYLYLSVFDASAFYALNNSQVIGFAPVSLANGLLKWEATISRNIGFDIGLFNNRLQLSFDRYRNSSKDLLLDRVVPSTSGYLSQTQNIGETLNEGVEIQIAATPVHTSSFRWDLNFNISFNKNKIVSLGPSQNSFLVSSGWAGSNQPSDFNVIVGRPVGTIWGLVTDGFYTLDDFNYDENAGTYTRKEGVPDNQLITSIPVQPGVIKFRDIDGNGVINDSDRTVIGVASPKSFGGLNQTFTYKNFDLSVFVNFQYGNDVLNANKLEFSSGYTVNSNLLSIMDGRWRNVNAQGEVVTDPGELAALNAKATIWSPLTTASSFYVHSWAVEDGSFLRINNITLGYTLPEAIRSRLKLSNFRIYATVNNLAVITNYTGYDPEANTRRRTPLTPGVDYAAYPRSKGYVMGVNLSF
jgi:TonB-linked SusC/RagA family outer membrane protein